MVIRLANGKHAARWFVGEFQVGRTSLRNRLLLTVLKANNTTKSLKQDSDILQITRKGHLSYTLPRDPIRRTTDI